MVFVFSMKCFSSFRFGGDLVVIGLRTRSVFYKNNDVNEIALHCIILCETEPLRALPEAERIAPLLR